MKAEFPPHILLMSCKTMAHDRSVTKSCRPGVDSVTHLLVHHILGSVLIDVLVMKSVLASSVLSATGTGSLQN